MRNNNLEEDLIRSQEELICQIDDILRGIKIAKTVYDEAGGRRLKKASSVVTSTQGDLEYLKDNVMRLTIEKSGLYYKGRHYTTSEEREYIGWVDGSLKRIRTRTPPELMTEFTRLEETVEAYIDLLYTVPNE